MSSRSSAHWKNAESRNAQEKKKRDILLFKCLEQFATEEQTPDTESIQRLVVLSDYSKFREKFDRIVSIPFAASKALKFIVHRVRNHRTKIHNLVGFEIAALDDYMKDNHNSSTLAPYVSSPSNVSSASSNSSNSLLEENETLKKRVKELETIAQEQRHRVVKTMDDFKANVRDERVERLLVPKGIAKELYKSRNKCNEQKSMLDRIQELALVESEYQINGNDSLEMKTLKESMNARISSMDAMIQVRNETHKKQDEEIKSLQTKLKSLYEEAAKHKKNTKSNLESQVKQLKEKLEAVTQELNFEKMENEEHLGAIETLLVEDRPDAPSTGNKRTHDHIENSSQSYLEECKGLLQSQAIEDIDLSPETRKEKCTEDLAGHKVPKRMKQIYERMGEKYSFTKEMSQLPEAIGEALETYINEGVITFPAVGKLGSKKTVIDRLSFPDQNESDESKTTQQVLDFFGGKLSHLPNSLRMPDISESLTVIISDQEPIEYPPTYVTKINKNRPKMIEEDQEILDGLLKRRNYLAEVAERTQMKMIQLTIDKLGLEVLAEVDQRSEQHKARLGREDLINFEGEDILRLKMEHPTRMKHDRGLYVPVEEPLKVSVRLLDAAGMLPDEITWEIVYERLLLCLDSEFQSEDFNVDHYRFTAHSIIDFCSMTYFSQPQKDEARRRLSLAQKRRWQRLSPEARQEIKGRISNALQGREIPPERKLAISNALQGRELSAKHKLAISNALQGREIPPEHKLAIRNGNKGSKRSQEHILALSKANAKYYFRVTNRDTKEILFEDYTRKQVDDSEFAANCYQTNKFSLLNHLQRKFNNANITGSIILNVSGVDYRIEKYLRNK